VLEFAWICARIQKNEYIFSMHGDLERQKDNLSVIEIEEAVMNGRILDTYPDTGRGKSCLVAGFTSGGKPIHIVCGERNDWLIVITVYIPIAPKFKSLFERGEK
jgi:hypothetical protein